MVCSELFFHRMKAELLVFLLSASCLNCMPSLVSVASNLIENNEGHWRTKTEEQSSTTLEARLISLSSLRLHASRWQLREPLQEGKSCCQGFRLKLFRRETCRNTSFRFVVNARCTPARAESHISSTQHVWLKSGFCHCSKKAWVWLVGCCVCQKGVFCSSGRFPVDIFVLQLQSSLIEGCPSPIFHSRSIPFLDDLGWLRAVAIDFERPRLLYTCNLPKRTVAPSCS